MTSTGRTNEEYENLGFKSDQTVIKRRLDVETKATVAHQLELKKLKLHEKIKKKELLLEKRLEWTDNQIADNQTLQLHAKFQKDHMTVFEKSRDGRTYIGLSKEPASHKSLQKKKYADTRFFLKKNCQKQFRYVLPGIS